MTSIGCVRIVAIDPAREPDKNLQKESNYLSFNGFRFAVYEYIRHVIAPEG